MKHAQLPFFRSHRLLFAVLVGCAAVLLGACAGTAGLGDTHAVGTTDAAAAAQDGIARPLPGWHALAIPGKTSTLYRWEKKDGRGAWAASSTQSASLWRRKVDPVRQVSGELHFSWWVKDLVENGNVADIAREDAPARVVLGFDGDLKSLSGRTRLMFDLAEALTGEAPPYATLMYVWDATAPVGSVIVNPRSDRVRKIVVDSGPQHLRQWRDHKRDLAADFRLAFGEEPGALKSVALMSDSDNTRSSAMSWFGEVELH